MSAKSIRKTGASKRSIHIADAHSRAASTNVSQMHIEGAPSYQLPSDLLSPEEQMMKDSGILFHFSYGLYFPLSCS